MASTFVVEAEDVTKSGGSQRKQQNLLIGLLRARIGPWKARSRRVTRSTSPSYNGECPTGRSPVRASPAAIWSRIEAFDRNGPALNSIIEINPEALEIATQLDRERVQTGPRGPLHGIPVVLKANIDTADRMETTAGSLALKGHIPPKDAFLVSQLRAAGAVILAKSNLSEWANFRSARSTSGWSSLGGQTKNPYDPRRNPCGSSSGSAVAVAASFTAVAVGTETNGSIVCPASVNGIVGIKPSLGVVSRSGIIPIAHSQDTAGPMARTVRDAAVLFDAMCAHDKDDPQAQSVPGGLGNLAEELVPDALRGARLGVLRTYPNPGDDPRLDIILDNTIARIVALGGVVVDDVGVKTDGMVEASREVLLYEFKAGLAEYLNNAGARVSSLADVIEFNTANAEVVMPYFSQEMMVEALSRGSQDDMQYQTALADSKRISQAAISNALSTHVLDALIVLTTDVAWETDLDHGDPKPGRSSAGLAAIAGYPSITLPAGDIGGLPVGVSFIGAMFDDAKLIRYAYALEQGGYQRRPPVFNPVVRRPEQGSKYLSDNLTPVLEFRCRHRNPRSGVIRRARHANG